MPRTGPLLYNRVACDERVRVSVAKSSAILPGEIVEGCVTYVAAHRVGIALDGSCGHGQVIAVLRRVDVDTIEVCHRGGI